MRAECRDSCRVCACVCVCTWCKITILFCKQNFCWWWVKNAKHYAWKSIIPTMCVFVFECVWVRKIGTIIDFKNEDRMRPTAHGTLHTANIAETTNDKCKNSSLVCCTFFRATAVAAALWLLLFRSFRVFFHLLLLLFAQDECVWKCMCEKLVTTDLEVENEVNEMQWTMGCCLNVV